MGAQYLPGHWLRNYRVGGTAAAALERLLETCRQQGTQVILVSVPVTLPHRQWYTPPIEASFQAYLNRLTRAYGCRCVDYRDRVPDAFFLDSHHLNDDGQLYFTRLLVHDLLAPLWQGKSGPGGQVVQLP
jgi:hypothetical protein